LLPREEFHQVLLDLHGIGVTGEPEPQGEASHMGVHNDPLVDPEGEAFAVFAKKHVIIFQASQTSNKGLFSTTCPTQPPRQRNPQQPTTNRQKKYFPHRPNCGTWARHPFDYLKDVLTRLPHHTNKTVDQLTPNNWRKKHQMPAAYAA
jgi:hypothetical protein